ncbi:MAG: TIGR02281 family clan AA aspartic protease [Burkholderiaceae bacterium]|nr:TIGR02281 family clan AA aspartic protease [Burkholderiaceae bacterium]MDH3459472.1 TIGR02281 family clan AA aspartic protease [Burkholderiaceae bacterium]
MRALYTTTALLFAGSVAAQSVSMSGSMGNKALLIIDGGAPRAVAAGNTVDGVKVISVAGSRAEVEIDGKRQTLQIGDAPVSVSGLMQGAGARQIVLTASSGGHFVSSGSINGRAVQFMVDTGATSVALSQAEAERIGLDYKKGPRGLMNTANGQVPVHYIALAMVRLGEVEVYNVEAAVLPAQMENVLLGNSFLSRFQMKRENDRMTLDRRF